MAAHRAWKLQYDSSPRGFGSCATLQLRGTMGGPDLTQGATGGPFGSDYYSGSYDFAKAFDNDPSTFWSSSTSSGHEFIGWDWGAGNSVDIVQFSFLPRPDSFAGPDAPTTGGIEWTDDDPNVSPTWTRSFSFGPTSGWAIGVAQVFPDVLPPGVADSRMSEYLIEGPSPGVYDSRMSEYLVEGSNNTLFVSRTSQYIILGPDTGTRSQLMLGSF